MPVLELAQLAYAHPVATVVFMIVAAITVENIVSSACK